MNALQQTHHAAAGNPCRSGRLWRNLALALCVTLLGGCAADRLQKEGRALIDQGRYEEGLARLDEAAKADPDNRSIRSELLRTREQMVAQLVSAGYQERAGERYDAAEALFRRALGLHPENARAQAGLEALRADRRHANLLADARKALERKELPVAQEKVALVLVENPASSAAINLKRQLDDATVRENLSGPTLNTKLRKPVTLQFRDANLKMVLEALARTSGINIILDKDVRSDLKVTVFVKDTNIEDTLDLILFQNQLVKKVMGENTVLIYPNTPAKQKDYEELKIRRFQLATADPKQVQTALKTLLKTRDIYVDEKTNAVIIRDTAPAVRLAEKLVMSLDQPEAEVMLEVEVLEVSRNRALELGIAWPGQVGFAVRKNQTDDEPQQFFNPNTGTFEPFPNSTTSSTDSDFTLRDLRNLNSGNLFLSTPLSVTINAAKTNGDINTLASPRIRARNREKAKILIGSRVPVITNSVTPVSTGSPVVTGTVNYLDVGLKLEVEPTVHLDGDVAIKVNLEVSNITSVVSQAQSGTRAYEIGTRTAQTVLRLKDGETQILAGLIQDEDRRDATKVPALGEIPILGRLFGSQRDENRKTEVVLSVTPRVIRNPQNFDLDTLEYWSGTETNLRNSALSMGASGSAGVMAPGQAGGAVPLGGPRSPYAARPGAPAAAPAPGPQAAAAPQPVALTVQAPATARVGDKFSYVAGAQAPQAVNGVGITVSYDPAALKVLSVSEGDFMRKNNVPTNFTSDVEPTSGQVLVELEQNGGQPVSGSGSVAVIQFEVVGGEGSTQVTLSRAAVSGAGDANMPSVIPPPHNINLAP